MNITNDNEFKAILAGLDISRQRKVAAAFVEGVLSLCSDPRVNAAIDIVKRDGVTELELAAAYQMANTARVESFCPCGKEIDWRIQTGHFVAKAALDCAKPAKEDVSLAWDAAMDARIARTCEGIASGETIERREVEREVGNQYRILSDFIGQ
ncbi:conserved hypothetical protein [Gammaproteobacteria bacterium]